ncbi:hypothetical protein JQ633_34245 [Bradyrhizobium tropiciagri]|uniref:hypothetical protein n=1 Tax=Bradyrhizobium tropiciagri TaxID=312253 RepID=UPI001BA789F1|nr:hypothetical protein [Bradyrhizobium tropiciagri]MBR0875457.1 hypothetical protein [Bradyrhizobium tropiciagri]
MLATTSAVMAETRFTCDPPRGKRIELGPSAKSADAQWIDDDLDTIHPAVAIDGQTLSVTWGATPESKGAKLTTYVFAAARRDATSIVATRVDETTAEIFRFYFGSKVLYKLTTRAATSGPDGKLPSPFVATYIASCREQ